MEACCNCTKWTLIKNDGKEIIGRCSLEGAETKFSYKCSAYTPKQYPRPIETTGQISNGCLRIPADAFATAIQEGKELVVFPENFGTVTKAIVDTVDPETGEIGTIEIPFQEPVEEHYADDEPFDEYEGDDGDYSARWVDGRI